MSSGREFVFCSTNLPNNSYPIFEDMRQKGILCDVTFKIGGRSISAHRVILAAGIPYFRDTIYGDVATGVFEKEMELPTIDCCAFESLIEFIYSCKITITNDNVKDLLSAACCLDVEEVKEACCKFLKDNLDPETVLDIRHQAHNLECLALVETADHYIWNHFEKVAQSESFLNLSYSFLEELIRRNDLRVSSEEKVLECVIRWVKHSPAERNVELSQLLKNVRLTLINLRYLTENVASQEFIRTSIPCRDLLDEAKNYHLFPKKQKETFSFPTEPRYSEDNGKNGTEPVSSSSSKLLYQELRAGVSNDHRDVQTQISERNFRPASYPAQTPIEVSVNVCGENRGQVESKAYFERSTSPTYRNTVLEPAAQKLLPSKQTTRVNRRKKNICDSKFEIVTTCSWKRFDSKKNEWYISASGTHTHTNGWVVKLKNEVYLFFKSFTLEYSIQGTCLTFSNCFNGTDRVDTAAAVLDNCLYVCGGKDSSATNLVEKFDFQTLEWSTLPSMQSRRISAAAVTLGGYIYVLGGENKYVFRGVEKYRFGNEDWTTVEPMVERRSALAAAALNDCIYVCGGEGISGLLNSAEFFNPVNNQWTLISPMNNIRSKFNLISYRGKLMAFGGHLNSVEVYTPETKEWCPHQRLDCSIFSEAVFMV